MSDRIGTAMKPAEVKCCSIGRPGDGKDYLCFVTKDNREIYLQLRDGIELLLLRQLLRAGPAKAS
jgi:hypothetical protein